MSTAPPAAPAPPAVRAALSCELDGATRPFNGPIPRSTEAMREDLGAALLRAAESLLVCDAVVFKVYGENVVAAALVDCFGIATVEALLERGALRFVLARAAIGVLDAETSAHALFPLVAGAYDRAEFTDPTQSAAAGLRGWSSLSRIEVARLAPKIAANTIVAPDAAEEVLDRIMHAHAAGELAALALPEHLDLGHCEPQHVETLAQLALALLDVATMIDAKLDLFDGLRVWDGIGKAMTSLRAQRRFIDVKQSEVKTAHVVDIGALFLTGALRFDQIPELRDKEEAKGFRAGLWGPSNDGAAVKAFMAMLSRSASKIRPTALLDAHLATIAPGLGKAAAPIEPPAPPPIPEAAAVPPPPAEAGAAPVPAEGEAAVSEPPPPAYRLPNPLDLFWIERVMRDRPRHLWIDTKRAHESTPDGRAELRALAGAAHVPAHPGIGARAIVQTRFAQTEPLPEHAPPEPGKRLTLLS